MKRFAIAIAVAAAGGFVLEAQETRSTSRTCSRSIRSRKISSRRARRPTSTTPQDVVGYSLKQPGQIARRFPL
jgi:hypothetical protein